MNGLNRRSCPSTVQLEEWCMQVYNMFSQIMQVCFMDRETEEVQWIATSHQGHAEKLQQSEIHVLHILYRIQVAVFIPLRPPQRMYKVSQVTPHYDRPRIVPPRATQKGKTSLTVKEREIRGSLDGAVVERESSVLIRVFPALSSDHVALPWNRFPG